jgi:hypothetical protein
VSLEHVLRKIKTDRGNLHVDGSPHVIRLRRSGARAVHHISCGLIGRGEHCLLAGLLLT